MDEGIVRLFEVQKKSPSTQIVGREIKSYDSVTSTNEVAFDLALKGAVDGTVIFASSQTKGKGRLNRGWVSPPDKGIYLSLILRPEIRPDEAQEVTLMSALSVVKAIRDITSLPALIKWPNDVLIEDKKVCGILTEMDAETERVKFLIVGIGINVNTNKKDLPDTAISLKEVSGEELELDKFLLELLKQLDKYYLLFKQDKARIIKECKELSYLWGKRIKVKTIDRDIEGQAIDLDERGALIVRLDNGFLEKVLSGDVLMVS